MKERIKPYLAFFEIRFNCGIQYRTAAAAGVLTQIMWGMMQILLYHAFYKNCPENFPMGFSQTATYFWLRQAFMRLFIPWAVDADILEAVTSGQIAYELLRPLDLYDMWFLKSLASRVSKTILRCIPVLLVGSFVPAPFGLMLRGRWRVLPVFLISIVAGACVVTAFMMLIYGITVSTLSSAGIRTLALSAMEFLAGGIIPLPFLPDSVRKVVEVLPFAAMQNMPYRIYSGNISGWNAVCGVGFQLLWLLILVITGKLLFGRTVRRAVVQGG